MPEGHTIHREARDQKPMLAGRDVAVSSPQGRFADSARRLDGRTCRAVEAFGKHLVYRFETGDHLHIHLGLFGRIRKAKRPEKEPRGAVRVRLMSDTHVVDINGPTICEILDDPGLATLLSRIGPDVLRPDADPDRAFARIAKSRAPIGRLIMDQSVMAGIGNIYRTEILWRLGLHPDVPGRAVDRALFDRLWEDSCRLLGIGVKRRAIVTVEEALATGGRRKKGERFNIFGKETCPACAGPVRKFDIAGRRAFACETCQPVPVTD